VERLEFLAHARALGFSIDDCRALIALREDPHRASADVKRIAQGHLDGIDESMRATLSHLVACCHGDDRPDCPILADLAQPGA
jgi:MerR family transcriptional regulator, copper efflux regulator